MKFYCKPTLTLFLLLYVAIQSAQAQDTLRITLQDAVRIARHEKQLYLYMYTFVLVRLQLTRTNT